MNLILILLLVVSPTQSTEAPRYDNSPQMLHAPSTKADAVDPEAGSHLPPLQLKNRLFDSTRAMHLLALDWEKLPEGCRYTGNSACGGSDRFKCNKNQRYFTWDCVVLGNVYHNAGCKVDTAC